MNPEQNTLAQKRFFVEVGISGVPFPIRVLSKREPDGQATVAQISIAAEIMKDFEARWINRFMQIVHRQGAKLGTQSLRAHALEYLKEFQANAVRVCFEFPFFVEKVTPVSRERCLVQHRCASSVKLTSADEKPEAVFAVTVPCLTTHPGSAPDQNGGLFAQLTEIKVEVESREDVYLEDLVELVDRHALSPTSSVLTTEDQASVIRRVHEIDRSSVVVTDEIKAELARDARIDWYSVRALNRGLFHYHDTFIRTQSSDWVPSSRHDEDEP